MQSLTMCQFTYKNKKCKIAGNLHTLQQLKERGIAGETILKMVKQSINQIHIQETVAIINGDDKLLVLRIHEYKLFVITCLVDCQQVKNTTRKIYLERGK